MKSPAATATISRLTFITLGTLASLSVAGMCIMFGLSFDEAVRLTKLQLFLIGFIPFELLVLVFAAHFKRIPVK